MHTRTPLVLLAFVATLGAQGTITSTAPSSVLAGGATFLMAVNGSGFTSSNIVQWDGVNITTQFASATQLAVTVSGSLIATAGSHTIRVKQSSTANVFSNTVTFNVNNPVPTVSVLSPSSTPVGSGPITLDFSGTNFVAGSIARLGGTSLVTAFLSATHIQASVPASMTTIGATLPVEVFNPAPGGGTASNGSFLVANVVPTLTTITPTTATAGTGGFNLSAFGSNFNVSSVVRFDGSPLPTTLLTPSQMIAAVSSALLASGATHTISVNNPGTGGGTSASQTFTVNNPVPVLASLSPAAITVTTGSTTVIANGSGFVASSVMRLDGAVIPTALVDGSHLSGTINGLTIPVGGTHTITVFTPAPIGGTSTGQTLTVDNAVPTLASISQSTAFAGGSSFLLLATGTGYNASSTIRFDGSPLATSPLSVTQLTATITAALLATAANHTITVGNPIPGGGTSGGFILSVTNPVPALVQIVPTTVPSGSDFTLTAIGSGCCGATTIQFDGAGLATTLIDTAHVSTTVPAVLIASVGTHAIRINNPIPGGGISSALTLTVQNPAPSIGNLSPSTILVGIPTTLTVTGSGFIPASVIRFSGIPLTTTFVSSSQLTGVATALATGTASIDVLNPAPGGGISALTPLAMNNPIPVVSSLSPAGTTVNAPPPSLTVNGSGFVGGTQVLFDGNPLPTAFINSGAVAATVPAGAMNPASVHQVSVVAPGPGGGVSNSVAFTVGNPAPVITSLSALSIPGGGSDALVTVTGAQFMAATTADASGTPIGASFVSSSQMTLVFPTSLQRAIRSFTITLTNPGPGGGSASTPFTVGGPFISACSPAVIPVMTGASSPITFTVTGGSFQAGDTIRINGAVQPTTLVNAQSLSCTLTGSLAVLLQPGGFAVTVTRLGSFSFVTSNAFGVPVGIATIPDNAGTVTLAPAPPVPGQSFNLRVELPVASGPVTLLAEVPAPPTILLGITPGFDLVIGPGLNSPIILADGLGLFGPPTPTLVAPYGLASFGIPAGHGVFELLNLAAPPVQAGITFSLAAIYVDPSSPIGLNATHVGGPYSL